jgi:hypothetical protein
MTDSEFPAPREGFVRPLRRSSPEESGPLPP